MEIAIATHPLKSGYCPQISCGGGENSANMREEFVAKY